MELDSSFRTNTVCLIYIIGCVPCTDPRVWHYSPRTYMYILCRLKAMFLNTDSFHIPHFQGLHCMYLLRMLHTGFHRFRQGIRTQIHLNCLAVRIFHSDS